MKKVSVLFVFFLLSTASHLNAGRFNPVEATLEDTQRKIGKLQERITHSSTIPEEKVIMEGQIETLKALSESKSILGSTTLESNIQNYIEKREQRILFRQVKLEEELRLGEEPKNIENFKELRQLRSNEKLKNLGSLENFPIEILHEIMGYLSVRDHLSFYKTSWFLKTVTEGTRGYSQIRVLKNTAKALSAYVDVVIERMKGQNGPKTISFGIRVRSASKDWTFYPSFAEYDSFIEYSQTIPIKFHPMWFPEGNVRDTITSEWEEWDALQSHKRKREDPRHQQYHNLLKGKNGCECNPKEAARINSELAEEGDFKARSSQFYDLLKGKNGYEANPEEAVRLNNTWAEKGDRDARCRVINGLLSGENGYKRNVEEAVERNNTWAKEGDQVARERAFKGRLKGENGYTLYVEKAIKLNDIWVKEGDREAKKREIHMYLFGEYGIPRDPEEAYRLMRQRRVLL